MIGETAQVVVDLLYKSNLASGVAKDERALGSLNTATKTSGTHMTTLSGASGMASKGMAGFGGAMTHAKGAIGGLLSGPLGLLGLGAGLLSVGGAIKSGIGKAQEMGAEVRRLTALTGESASSMSALAAGLEHFGIGAATAQRSIGFLEKNVGLLAAKKDGIVKFQKEFGLAILDSNGKIKTANELILTSSDYFLNKSIPATMKAAVLAKLYGRSWQELIPVLSAGRAQLAAAEKEAARLGLTLTGQNLKDLVKLRDATRDWNTALGGLEVQIGLALVPALTELSRTATAFVAQNRTQIVDFFKGGAKFAGEFGHAVGAYVVPVFSAISSAWGQLPGPLKDLLITGFVANKAGSMLFGKSLFAGIGGLLGKAGGGLLQRGGSPANPLFVADVTPGVGGKGGGGIAGGGILKFVAALGLATVAVELWQNVLNPLNEANAQQTRDIGTNVNKGLSTASGATLRSQRGALLTGLNDISGSTAMLGPLQSVLYGAQLDALKASIRAIDAELVRRGPGGLIGSRGPTDDLRRTRHAAFVMEFDAGGRVVLRDAVKAGNAEVIRKSADLIALFRTSTNPSLRSMQENLVRLKALQAQGDTKTRAALGADIRSLSAHIDAVKAAVLTLNSLGGILYTGGGRPSKDDLIMRPRSSGGHPGVPVSGKGRDDIISIRVSPSIRDTNTAQDLRRRWGKTPSQVGAQ